MSTGIHASVATSLETVEQRYTAGRRRIVETLAGAGRPLTVAELVAGTDGLAQSSAYRNLTVLERAGTVRRIQGADEFARYELSEDLTGHHHHLICTGCAAVIDVEMSSRLERVIERAVAEIAAETRFSPSSHRLDLVGLCADCAAAHGAPTAR